MVIEYGNEEIQYKRMELIFFFFFIAYSGPLLIFLFYFIYCIFLFIHTIKISNF